MTPAIALVVEAPEWRKGTAGLLPQLRRAARLAWTHGPQKARARNRFTILLADDAKLKALNADFRGKDKPTNVLSFPAQGSGPYLGDIAIAFGVTSREARDARKPFGAHATHLVVHGVLHLLGYDHERAREARVMEPLEIAILAELGIANPYAARAA
ncbi:MAG: rRNA maturation RNase YbeY [Rhizomicrobium sp.]|jgi:probable rRNA maturation factor